MPHTRIIKQRPKTRKRPGANDSSRGESTKKRPKAARKQQDRLDGRKQLFNKGSIGPIQEIQVSTERIVQLNGILFDLDPCHFRAGHLLPKIPKSAKQFYHKIIRPMLDRHPTLAKCEVRMTGTGVHAILCFEEPVVIHTDGERERWAGIVQVVQASLPIDPDQPGITATTRALGSTNSKNGKKVVRLQKATKVSQEEVLGLYEEMCSSPFATVMKILIGDSKVSPCPVCGEDESKLSGLNHLGTCYGSCGKVRLEQLYDVVLAPRTTTN